MNDYDQQARIYNLSSKGKDALFSEEIKNIILGLSDNDLRKSFMEECLRRVTELGVKAKWNEWLNKFYDNAEHCDWSEMTAEDLISATVFKRLLAIKDTFQRSQAESKCINRAQELKRARDFNKCYKSYKISLAQKRGTSEGNRTEFIDQPIELVCGDWITDEFTVRKNEFNVSSGEFSMRVVSPLPILPTAIITNIDSGNEKIEVSFYKENRWQSLICERSTTASSNKIIELSNRGIEVNSENSKLLVRYIADCVAMNMETLPKCKSVGHLGWVENKFMPYDTEIKFDGEKENKYLFEAVTESGSYEKWVAFTGNLRKNIYLRMQMAASFASPLIERCKALSFVFHLWGGTGAGKTVGLMVAMSIWGNPKMGKMTRTLNMTPNSMMSMAGFLCNLPFGGDELQTIKSRWENYDTLIMKLTEGSDRGRMYVETRGWQNSFIFTGEEPCTKSESGGGVKNRVIEIECKTPVVENGNNVVKFISHNYGYAGRKFIEGILNEKQLDKEYTEYFDKIMLACNTTEKQAMAMGMILLADKLACKYIYLNEVPLDVSDVAEFLTDTKDVDISERAYEFIVNHIGINKNKFEADNNGEFWGEITNDGVAIINKVVLKRELSAVGFEFDAVKRKWAEKLHLIKDSRSSFSHQTSCNGAKGDFVKIKLPRGELLLDAVSEEKQTKLPF